MFAYVTPYICACASVWWEKEKQQKKNKIKMVKESTDYAK